MERIGSVIVIGGGIGGLTVAHGLARSGLTTTVVEAARREDRLGTGITLLGNALRALDSLELADDVIGGGYGWDAVTNLDSAGNVVHTQRNPRTFRPDAPAALGIMRTRLAETLERRARTSGATIEFGVSADGVEQHADGVTVTLSSGDARRCDFVVAADGVYSRTRTAVFGAEHQPRFTGQSGWRYTVPRPENLTGLTLYRAQSKLIGGLPLSHDLAYLFHLENSPEHLRFAPGQLYDQLRERFSGFSAPELQKAAEEIDESRHVSFRPYDVILMPRPWFKGRVVLLGDAAHALTPQLTSGGGMAIEDAAVLTKELSAHQDIAAAFESYDARRSARVEPIFDISLRICELEKQPDTARDEAMRLLMEAHGMLAQPF